MPSRLSGTKIRAKMLELDISPTAMIPLTKLSASTVDRVINNRATGYNDHTAQAFANALGCTVMDIVDDEYVVPVITNAISTSVETAIVGAVAEAVTVIVDKPADQVAQNVPDMTVHLPPALDVAQYFTTLQQTQEREIAEMKAEHDDHIHDLRKEMAAWKIVSALLFAALILSVLLR